MLQLILGRNGTDSEKYITDLIKKEAEKEVNVLYIVPEQYTVFAERTLVKCCPPGLLKYIEVTNFSRLSNIVSRNTGIRPPKMLSDGGRYILMSKAFESAFENLKIYNRPFSGDFIMHLCDLYDEIGFYRINLKALRQELGKISDTTSGKKLLDLFYIMECYEAMNQEGKTGNSGELAFLEGLLQSYKGFQNHIVVFSGFDFLTPQELMVTSLLMKGSREMYFSLCTDTLIDKEGGYGLFSGVKELGIKLKHEAKENHIPANEIVLSEKREELSKEIAFLEKFLFLIGADQFNDITNDIMVYSAKDMYDEAEFIACEISKLIREKGYSYRDFTVIGRNMEEYKGIIDTVFAKFHIPCFEDARSDLLTKPLVILILSAVNTAIYGFETKNILSILKSGLLDISEDDICLLQGYTYVWNINYGKWTEKEDWYYHPDGFSAEMDERKKEELDKINQTRKRLILPLLKFCDTCKNTNESLTMSKALFELLSEYMVPDMLKHQAERFRESGELALAKEQEQLWNLFISLLDELYEVSKEEPIDLKHFREYLELSFASASIGKIPTSLDEIALGNADRIRVKNPKCVFVVGVNDGVFPKTFNDDGMITDNDKAILENLGIEFSKTTEDSTFEERFFCYKALTAPSDKLYISYYKTGLDGREAMPSYLISAVESIFPRITKVDFSDVKASDRIERPAPAFDKLALLQKEKSEFTETLEQYFKNKPYYGELLGKVTEIKQFGKNEKLSSADVLKALFGFDMSFSPTKVEAYFDCAFKHFCKYGLKASKKQKAELNSMQVGSYLHSALEQAVKEAGTRKSGIGGLSDMEIKRLSARVSKKYLEENLGNERNARFKYIYRRLSKTLVTLLTTLRDEFTDSLFVPVDFELPINAKSEVPSISIPLEDGGKILITGVVDRVDVYEKNNIKFIRVVDYKTGTKNFKLSDIVNGLNLQMLIYLFSIWKNGKNYYGKEITPAGILYYPARRDILAVDRYLSSEDIKNERSKKMRMNGLLLDEKSVLEAMEPSLSGRFLPVKQGAKGMNGLSSIASLEELSRLSRYIENIISKMGNEIKNGEIAINPISDKDYNACKFCEMKAICGFEKGRNKSRKYKSTSKEELLGETEAKADEQTMDI